MHTSDTRTLRRRSCTHVIARHSGVTNSILSRPATAASKHACTAMRLSQLDSRTDLQRDCQRTACDVAKALKGNGNKRFDHRREPSGS